MGNPLVLECVLNKFQRRCNKIYSPSSPYYIVRIWKKGYSARAECTMRKENVVREGGRWGDERGVTEQMGGCEVISPHDQRNHG